MIGAEASIACILPEDAMLAARKGKRFQRCHPKTEWPTGSLRP
jgi:hypothetical protein